MKKVIIDGSKITSREELHKFLQQQFDFPDYYGRNLDALYDLLSCYSDEVEIQMIHMELLKSNLGGYANMLCELLNDVSNENHVLTIRGEENV